MPIESKSALAQAAGQAITTRPLISLPFPIKSSSSAVTLEMSVSEQAAPTILKLTSSTDEKRFHTTDMPVPSTMHKQQSLVLAPKYRLFPRPDLSEKQHRRRSLTTNQRNEPKTQEIQAGRIRRGSETHFRSQEHDLTADSKVQSEQPSTFTSHSARLQKAPTRTKDERRTIHSGGPKLGHPDNKATSQDQPDEASRSVFGNSRPLNPATKVTARLEKRRTMTTRQFDLECLDLIKSHGVRKLLKSSNKGSPLPASSLSFRLNNAFEPFRNLCICDPRIGGLPIKLKSRYFTLGPRVLRIGASDPINLPLDSSRQLRPFLGIFHRPHPDNSPVYVLEYAACLTSQESPSSEPSYALACQIDITEFIKKLTYHTLAAKYQVEADAERKATQKAEHKAEHRKRGSIEIRHRDSAIMIDTTRNLSSLDVASRPGDQYKGGSVRIEQPLEIIDDDEPDSPINWLEIDGFPAPPKVRSHLPPTIAEELQSFLGAILRHYKDCFVLSPTSSLDGIFQAQPPSHWQISYTSSNIHASRDDLRIALSKTKQEVLVSLGAQLAETREIREVVRWGAKGERKMLCAVPMIREGVSGASCWLCFLLDAANA